MWKYLKSVIQPKTNSNASKPPIEKYRLAVTSILTNGLKSEVIALRTANISILAKWDAGGDNTCCNVSIDNEIDYETDLIKISWKLGDLIAEKLQLPNTGEYYNIGSGTIDINQADQVVLHYSAKTHYYDYGDDENENPPVVEWIKVDDPFQLSQYLHRLSIEFSVYITKEVSVVNYTKYNPFITCRILEGDEFAIPLSTELETFYSKIILTALQKYEKEFNDTGEVAGSKTVRTIDVTGTLEVGSIRLELRKTYLVIDYIVENKTIVLIE